MNPWRDQALIGRQVEAGRLGELIDAVRSGESRVLVLQGEAGIGKSALLEQAATSATGFRVLRAVGVESEMELTFAALHQLCLPLLDRLGGLAEPRRHALETAFRMRAGAPPDPFLIGLAVLDLFSGASERTPLLCVVDDSQWLDQGSAQVLGFVARRLLAESTGLILGTRPPGGPHLRGLPELEIGGLGSDDARTLLAAVTHARLDRHISDRIVAETRGNPLALIELTRGLSSTRMAGGLGLLSTGPLSGRIEDSFLSRVRELPAPARRLLLVAAAEPTGDPDLVRRAAGLLGLTLGQPGTEDLLSIGAEVRFRHPLVRSAVYRAASSDERRAAHRALAEVTDSHTAPERRAWHRAAAAAGPDEDVAGELERSAEHAQSRGGVAAAAAFLQRAVALSADPARRAERVIAAAETTLHAGDFEAVSRLLRSLDSRQLAGLQRGRATLVEGHLAYALGHGSRTASAILLRAAEQFAALDPQGARETAVHAWLLAGGVVNRDELVALSRSILDILPPGGDGLVDLILDGSALVVTEGRAAAAPILTKVTETMLAMPDTELLRWGRLAPIGPYCSWNFEALRALANRQVELLREAGALHHIPENLINLGVALLRFGDFAEAAAAVEEGDLITTVIGSRPLPPYVALQLYALRGQEPQTVELVTDTLQQATATEFGTALVGARLAAAILYNGLARHAEALRYAREAEENWNPWLSAWVLPETIEAASRAGDAAAAHDALDQLLEATAPFDSDFPAGLQARARALLADDADADALYREAIERLGRTRMRPDLARAHLLYGEWLRRHQRRLDARGQLRIAYDMFVSIGMEAFAARTRRELMATGETVRKRTTEAANSGELTAQELQIARLVGAGLSNPEVGARLFLSPRTVEWHLRKIFDKLSISSRRELRDVKLSG
ncbi:transcriptional regulator [Paractinoplanes deccanensis]|uniref:Transcriptional regulator n=1 Tax=Paractinoplanes deccanensis TaxID=113561 RepID=A0ABQ3Y3N2_9ACTN|nr:LuxR family transcriptional regulator [Actinoplanes deccanensis]GID74572.1 transcriptional regulator [Actinoplanes deccanensis]